LTGHLGVSKCIKAGGKTMKKRVIKTDFFSKYKRSSFEGSIDIIKKELQELQDTHRIAIENKDIEGVLQCYSPVYIGIAPNSPILYGRQYIRTYLEEVYRDFSFYEDFQFVDIKLFGERVVTTYTFTSRMTPLSGGSEKSESGKGMAILKKSKEGKWQWEWNSYHYNLADL
jgi:ketosteroid isomerase-like protein